MDVSCLIEKMKGITIKADYTPFNMLNVLYQDVSLKEKAHDKLLAGLLNPYENHDYGHILINEFLNAIHVENATLDEKNDVKIQQPRYVKGRYIDIFISWKDSDGGKFAVIIEDKLTEKASDQPNQLKDYYEGIVAENFDVKKVVYMPFSKTRKSFKIQGFSNKNAIDFDALDIIEWLEKCIKKLKEKDISVGMLEQYQLFFKCLINKEFIKMKAEEILKNVEVLHKFEDLVVNLPKIVNSKEWVEAVFNPITSVLQEKYPNLIVGYRTMPASTNTPCSYYVQYRFEPHKYWVELGKNRDADSIAMYVASYCDGEDTIELANEKYTDGIEFDECCYYEKENKPRYCLKNQEELLNAIIPVLDVLSSYQPSAKPPSDAPLSVQ